MQAYIAQYLEDHVSAWSETTLKSERSRLNGVAKYLHMTPGEIYKQLIMDGRKSYSIKTMFIRLCALEAWAVKRKFLTETPFADFMEKHRNKFKHAYSKENLSMTFEDAMIKVQALPEPSRSMAIGILKTGLRVSETYKVKDGRVVGKGGKTRAVYGKIKATAARSTFSRHLAQIGLKPHTLRKLWATRLADTGATPADLCEAAGWTSITTAYNYLQSKDQNRLEALIKKATKG